MDESRLPRLDLRRNKKQPRTDKHDSLPQLHLKQRQNAPRWKTPQSSPSSQNYAPAYQEPDRYQPAQGQSRLGRDIKTGHYVDVPQASRREGLYLIGISGTGKTGLIENLIIQDIKQDRGVGLLDPHGDVTRAVLSRLPPEREKDVIYLDIADEDYPFGLNLFTCSNLNSAKAVQVVVDKVMHIFDKLFDLSPATTPRLRQYLRNCTQTLIVNPGYTMADMPLLLLDEHCRKKLLANVMSPQVQGFWKTYNRMKPAEQLDHADSTLNKLDELLQPLTMNIVGQSTSTIDVQTIMDEGKILLVKLDAQLDSVTNLVGSVLIALILNAAYARPANRRRQFNLYADEFQRFATDDFATLLTEARKFGIATTIAHQARFQPGMTDGIRATSLSAKNKVVFKVNSKDGEELAGEFDITPQEAWEEELEEESVEVVKPQRHERIEEEVEVEVEEDILEVTQDPVDYLVSARGTHSSMRVREITQNLLVTTLTAFKEQNSIKMLVNNLLVAVMDGRIQIKTDEFIDLMQKIAISYANKRFIYYTDSYMLHFAKNRDFIHTFVLSPTNWEDTLWEVIDSAKKRDLIHRLVYSPYNPEDVIQQFIEDEITKILEKKHKEEPLPRWDWAKLPEGSNVSNMTRKEKLQYGGYDYYDSVTWHALELRSFITNINILAEELAREPIRVPTGKKRMVKRIQPHITYLTHESEKITHPRKTILHPQRTYADMHKQVASELTNLGNFMARVRYKDANERLVECTIRTLDPKQQPDKPLFGQALQERLTRIKEQNIQDGYLRERVKVEDEIRQRQKQCTEPPPEEPPISRRPQR